MTTPAGGGAGRGAARKMDDSWEIPVGAHHGGSFGVYMRHKTERLHQQFHDVEAVQSRLFEGMVFHVNGHTDVPIEELRRQIVLHGGRVEQYASSRVTHILCKHLPHAKIRELTNQKLARGAHQQVPIVQPRFIQDCLAAGRRLPHAPYLVEGLRERHGQSLQGFFQQQRGVAKGEEEERVQQAMDVDEGEHEDEVDVAAVPQQAAAAARANDSAHSSPYFQQYQQQQQPRQSPAVSSPSPRSSRSGASSSTGGGGGGGGARPPWRDGRPPMSTKDDPQFLSRYYETSRLHWIGSFKAKLMQELGDEAIAKFKAAGGANRPAGGLVLHLDMDCFFVSALVRDRPELQAKPLAVAHAAGEGAAVGTGLQSSSEISSCNYVARAKGVRASMFLGEARRLCPDLVVLRYDFGVYEAVARQVYRIFFEEAAVVQPVSCDEAFLELAPGAAGGNDGEAAATRIRARILAETGCPASAGISTNMLLARLATKQAKPNGQRALYPAEAPVFLESLPVTDLPGVGWHLGKELKARGGITTCAQLQARALAELQEWFGDKTGRMLWERCRGEDSRRVAPELGGPKSIGAEVNWGVRFDKPAQVEKFVGELAEEVEQRLAKARVRGRQVVLKVKRSQYGPHEPEKLLGCGRCDNFSRSLTLPRATSAAKDIAAAALQLLRPLKVPPNLLRGIGIQMCKLEEEQPESPGGIGAWLAKQQPQQGKKRAASLSSPGPGIVDLAGEEEMEEGGGKGMTEAAGAAAAQQQEEEDGEEGGFGAGWEPVTPTPSPTKKQRKRPPPASGGTEVDEEEEEDAEVEVLEVLPSPAAGAGAGAATGGRKRARARTPAGGAAAASASAAAPPETVEHWHLSLSQMDEGVLAGLPPDVQREVMEAARPSAAVVAAAQAAAAGPASLPSAPSAQPPRLPGPTRSRGGGGRQLRVDAYDTRALQAEGADAELLAALPPLVRVELNEQFLRGGRKLPLPTPGQWQQPASASASPALARASSAASSPAVVAGGGRQKGGGGKRPLQRQGSLHRQQQQQRQATSPKRAGRARREEEDVEAEVVVLDGPAGAAAASAPRPSPSQRGRPRLFVVEGVDEVRRALLQWLRAIEDPQPPHAELLRVYLSELLADGRADNAWMLMRTFRRWAEGRPAWRAAYQAVLGALEDWLLRTGEGGGAGLCWAGLQLQREGE